MYNIPFKMQDAMPNIYQHWVTQDMMAYIQIALEVQPEVTI